MIPHVLVFWLLANSVWTQTAARFDDLTACEIARQGLAGEAKDMGNRSRSWCFPARSPAEAK